MASKLNSAGAVELGMAAEVCHGRLEGDAGARGHLLENHAKRLVLQNQRIAPGLLHGFMERASSIMSRSSSLVKSLVSM